MQESFLLVGLGNPGKAYENTRHNIGSQIVKAFAMRYGIVFHPSLVRVKGSLGEGKVKEKKVLLLLPLTYMNESGLSVRKCRDFYKPSNLIVVTDDIALPLGRLRLRKQGSSGGHKGLKSVEAHLGTQEYERMRIGISDREEGELVDHVLGRFTEEEQRELPGIIDKAIHVLEVWLVEGIDVAVQEV